jgi:DNA polymerase-3 subunit alpha
MFTVEECGLIKFDFLSLRALTTIDRTVKLIKDRHNITINPNTLEPDDLETFQALQNGDGIGVFQFEGGAGIRDLLIKYKPETLEDLAVINASFRPGPLQTGLVDQMVRVRQGLDEPSYLVPELEPILKETAGAPIYQEQHIKIFRDLAGFSSADADIARKAIGKKKLELVEQLQDQFLAGMKENNFSQSVSKQIFEWMRGMASYAFNKSHAVSYSYIGYQMAYLKTHYPLEFLCACLISDSNEPDKVISYIHYCRDRGIEILPPHINYSGQDFSISDSAIRFGLSAIKNVGKGPINAILRARKSKPFESLTDFISRLEKISSKGKPAVNRKQLNALIESGALDGFSLSRRAMLIGLEAIYDQRKALTSYINKMETYNKRVKAYKLRQKQIKEYENLSKEDKKGRKKPGKLKEPAAPEQPAQAEIKNASETDTGELLKKEKDLLGFYVSGHPLDMIENDLLNRYPTIEELKEKGEDKQKTRVLCTPSTIQEATAKTSKKRYARLVLEDKTGTIEAVIFSKAYEQHSDTINNTTVLLCDVTLDVVQGDLSKIVKLKVRDVSIPREIVISGPRVTELHIKPVLLLRKQHYNLV